MKWVIEGKLARASRLGYSDIDVEKDVVDAWVAEAKSMGIRTIICLLSGELSYYDRALHESGGLAAPLSGAGLLCLTRAGYRLQDSPA